jgi:hypothetical protein
MFSAAIGSPKEISIRFGTAERSTRDQLGGPLLCHRVVERIVEVLCLLRIRVVNNYSRPAVRNSYTFPAHNGTPDVPNCS